jgi:hypothetical protein
MAGQRGLSRSALLRRQNQNVHLCALSVSGAVSSGGFVNTAALARL